LYKARSLAVEAIRSGRVTVNGAPTKPAHEPKPGETVEAQMPFIARTLKVLGLPSSRVGAKLVGEYAEELTPPEEFEKARERARMPGMRPAGAGRPTKRERRDLDELMEE
jgi:ribosome-associated heat shock protein Hsp15